MVYLLEHFLTLDPMHTDCKVVLVNASIWVHKYPPSKKLPRSGIADRDHGVNHPIINSNVQQKACKVSDANSLI